MILREVIKLTAKPPSSSLPRPESELAALLKSVGQEFEVYCGDLILQEDLQAGRLELVRSTLERAGIDLRIRYSIRPIFDDSDYESSPLWVVYFSDIWIRELDFRETCPECNTARIRVPRDV